MKDKLDVLMRYNKYGDSIRKIARDTGFSRNTVREYIREFEESRETLIKQGPDVDTLYIIDTIVEKPQYDSSKRIREVMTDKFIEKIKEFLSDNDFKKEPTEALKKLSLFYGFNYRFCNIYSGNDYLQSRVISNPGNCLEIRQFPVLDVCPAWVQSNG